VKTTNKILTQSYKSGSKPKKTKQNFYLGVISLYGKQTNQIVFTNIIALLWF